MAKEDDSGLDPDQLLAVQTAARRALDRADAWNIFPTPIPTILEAANLRVAPASAFDPQRIMDYLMNKAERAATVLQSAISKVFGIYDADENLIHIDDTVKESKQNFLKLHEAGHHELPTHRKLFRVFRDCEKSLDPDTANLFEREANNFARFVLFQGDKFGTMAADHAFGIKTPIKLAKEFGASIYASSREYVRSNSRACALYVLEPVIYREQSGAEAQVRRIEISASFRLRFGQPTDQVISMSHSLGRALPIGRRMTRPTTVSITDRNGHAHECLAEAFDTTFNILILVYPLEASPWLN